MSNGTETAIALRRSWALALGTLLLAAALLAWGTGQAMAHARYERSQPAEGATVEASPSRVEVWFTQELRRSRGLPRVIVVDESGDVVSQEATLDDDDRTHVFVSLPPALPASRYTVIWHTLSDEDGEEAQGAFHFFVGGAAPTAGQPTPSPAPAAPSPSVAPTGGEGGSGGTPLWALVAGVLGGGAVGVAAGIAIGRRR